MSKSTNFKSILKLRHRFQVIIQLKRDFPVLSFPPLDVPLTKQNSQIQKIKEKYIIECLLDLDVKGFWGKYPTRPYSNKNIKNRIYRFRKPSEKYLRLERKILDKIPSWIELNVEKQQDRFPNYHALLKQLTEVCKANNSLMTHCFITLSYLLKLTFDFYKKDFPESTVLSDERDGVAIVWKKHTSEIKLICPFERNRPPYLYCEELKNIAIVNSISGLKLAKVLEDF